jgi:hypothetical protein
LHDGSVYYCDPRGNGYLKSSTKKIKGKTGSERSTERILEKRKLKKDQFYIYDMIDDSFITLKKLK